MQIGQGSFRRWTNADLERIRKYKAQNYRKGRGRKNAALQSQEPKRNDLRAQAVASTGRAVGAANRSECNALGLHPKRHPLGNSHHTDVEPSEQDRKIGDALAYFLGTLFDAADEDWFYTKRTSVDEWTRVARALRIHGLAITDATKQGKVEP